jgi:ABC-type ATPase with predicted acetyltransferase domain
MDYILANYKRVKSGEILDEQSAGIVDLQVHYATCLNQILRDYNLSKDDLLKLLMKSPQKLSDDNWALLHQIFRLPKPTFIIGLSRKAERFIKKRIKQLNLPQKFPAYFPANARGTIKKPIEVSNCSIHLDSLLMRTKNTRKVQHAFGVNKEMLRTVLFSNLNFDIKPGDIVLLCGPSGAGKTTLLSVLKHSFLSSRKISSLQSGHITSPRNVTVECLEPLRNAYPLVNSLGNVSFEHALYALNVSGLAEAHLYVRRFKELSNGQRYRAMVAKLIASKADIWIADEFCATLDPITANIVSRNLRRCAKKLGVTVILAAANWSEFIHELQPDTVVHLRSPWEYKIFNWDEFQEAVARSHAIGNATEPLFNFRLK